MRTRSSAMLIINPKETETASFSGRLADCPIIVQCQWPKMEVQIFCSNCKTVPSDCMRQMQPQNYHAFIQAVIFAKKILDL